MSIQFLFRQWSAWHSHMTFRHAECRLGSDASEFNAEWVPRNKRGNMYNREIIERYCIKKATKVAKTHNTFVSITRFLSA